MHLKDTNFKKIYIFKKVTLERVIIAYYRI